MHSGEVERLMGSSSTATTELVLQRSSTTDAGPRNLAGSGGEIWVYDGRPLL